MKERNCHKPPFFSYVIDSFVKLNGTYELMWPMQIITAYVGAAIVFLASWLKPQNVPQWQIKHNDDTYLLIWRFANSVQM